LTGKELRKPVNMWCSYKSWNSVAYITDT